jgi:hypothetical protein
MKEKGKFTRPQLIEYGQLGDIVHGLGGWPDTPPGGGGPDPIDPPPGYGAS